jgi:transcription initiation factor TFIIIB Brf1 subunit/transcription initiation factor TFIIB
MTIYKPAVEKKISTIIEKLDLEPELVAPSRALYKSASRTAGIVMSRIRDDSLVLACVYITMRLCSKRPVNQDVFSYHFGISTATLRKTYKLVASAMDMDRQKIVSREANVGVSRS